MGPESVSGADGSFDGDEERRGTVDIDVNASETLLKTPKSSVHARQRIRPRNQGEQTSGTNKEDSALLAIAMAIYNLLTLAHRSNDWNNERTGVG